MRRAAGWRGVAVLTGAVLLLGLGTAVLADAAATGLGLGWTGLASQLFMGAGFWLVGFTITGLVASWLDEREARRGKLEGRPGVLSGWWEWVMVRARHSGCLLFGHSWRWPHPAARRPVCGRCGAIGRRERSTMMRSCEV